MPPSTAATLNLAASAAQCARVWRKLDAAFADRCLTAAERAWQAANDNPIFTLRQHSRQWGGGDYGDGTCRTSFSGRRRNCTSRRASRQYHDYLVASPYFAGQLQCRAGSAINWGDVGVLGTLTLALAPDRLAADEQRRCRI